MVFPVRYNPVKVKIRKLQRGSTLVDADFGVPQQVVSYSAPIEMEAQVNLGNKAFNAFAPTQAGDSNETKGHLVFAKRVMDANGWSVDKGDRIVEIAGVEVDFEVHEVRYESSLRGEFLLVYVEFREPVSHGSLERR